MPFNLWNRAVERGIETGDLDNSRKGRQAGPDPGKVVRLVQRCQRIQAREILKHGLIDTDRRAVMDAAVYHPVRNRDELPAGQQPIDGMSQLRQRRVNGALRRSHPDRLARGPLRRAEFEHGAATRLEALDQAAGVGPVDLGIARYGVKREFQAGRPDIDREYVRHVLFPPGELCALFAAVMREFLAKQGRTHSRRRAIGPAGQCDGNAGAKHHAAA